MLNSDKIDEGEGEETKDFDKEKCEKLQNIRVKQFLEHFWNYFFKV